MGAVQSGSGRKAGAIVLIGLGAFFLLAQLGVFSFDLMGFLWPFFVILPGLAFLYPAMKGGTDTAPLAIPGAIITGTGGILLYQNVTGHWESWAYIWALYPVFLGLGMVLMARRQGDRKADATGRGFVRWGLIAFLVMGGIFELFVFNRLGIGRYLIPLALILLGLWMMRGGGRGRRAADDFDLEEPFVPAGKPRKRTSAADDLRRQIDLALAEEDDFDPEA